jgi:hypothetical protein
MKNHAIEWLSIKKWSLERISVEGNRMNKHPLSAEWLDNLYCNANIVIKLQINPINEYISILSSVNVYENEAMGKIFMSLFLMAYRLKNGL